MKLTNSLGLNSKKIIAAASGGGGGGDYSGLAYSKGLYLDGNDDYLQAQAGDHVGVSSFPTGQTVANFSPAWDLITDTGTTPYSLSIDFRAHNDAGSGAFDIDIQSTDGSGGGFYDQHGSWRLNFNFYPGASWNYVYPRIWWKRATSDNGNGNDYNAAGNAYKYLANTCYLSSNTNHFANATIDGMWHNFTVTRGTSGAFNGTNIKFYLNGALATASPSVSGWEPGAAFSSIPNQKWTAAQGRRVYIGHYGGDLALGQLSIYNKELSQAEISDLYDGGAIAGGSPDLSEVMMQHPLGKSTASNLKGWWYLDVDGQNSDDDSGTTLQDKKNSADFQTLNTTISDLTSVTTPYVPLFVAGIPPAAVYSGEATTLTQNGADSNSTVTWYSDSNRTSLLSTGAAYTFSPSSTGATTLYTKDVNSVNGVEQTGQFDFTVSTAGHSTHSYDAKAESMDLISPDLASSDFTNGDFSMTFWQSQETFHNQWGRILYMDSQNEIQAHLNSGNYFFRIHINNVWHYPSTGTKGIVGHWNCWTFTWDTSAGEFKIYADGALSTTYTHTDFQTSIMAGTNTLKTKIDNKWGKIANIGIYDDVLTEAEAEALAGNGEPGASQDLEALSGSSSHLLAYWKINNDTFNNDGADHLNCEIDSNNDIPVIMSNASSKSTDRP